MPPEQIYVSTHVHTDGPIPGPHSLLTVAAVAHTVEGEQIGTFVTNVRELPGAHPHPVSLQYWRGRAEEWLTTRRSSRPPAVATRAFTDWVQKLPAGTVLVTDTTRPDYVFLYWYLQRFTDRWPFAGTDTPDAHRADPAGSRCPLTTCRALARAG